jgi:hypothetical protein
MPGMMDTVLNLGLNDETVEALAAASGDARFAYDSYRRFIQMYSDVVLGVEHHRFEEALEDYKERKGYELDTDLTPLDWKVLVASTRAVVRKALGRPSRRIRTSSSGARSAPCFELLDEPAPSPIAPARHPGRKLGHGGQRPGHGVRQYGRDLGHRRRLHPQPVDRREALYGEFLSTRRARTSSPASARRRTSPRPRDRSRLRQAVDGEADAGGVPRSFVRIYDSLESTTATCRTSNSPSSRASSGCCRPVPASAPPRRR